MGERFGYYIMNAVARAFPMLQVRTQGRDKCNRVFLLLRLSIYVLSLVGGLIADKTQNYKGTIIRGLVIMTLGYIVLSIPILATSENTTWLLSLTRAALFFIAFGNGLFKGNLQAIVGQLYDNPRYAAQRDSGFRDLLRVHQRRRRGRAFHRAHTPLSGWLGVHNLAYNASLPALCHVNT